MNVNLENKIAISSGLFNFHRNGSSVSITADLSTIEHATNPRYLQQQLYPDAIDTGFVMVSSKTMKKAAFVFDRYVRESDGGDIVAIKFNPTPCTIRQNPSLNGAVLTIFNT